MINKEYESPSRWLVLIIMSLVGIVNTVVLLSPAPLISSMASSFNLSLGQTTAIAMGVINFFIAISAIFGGYLLDKYSAPIIWIAGMLTSGVCLLLMQMPDMSPVVYSILRFLQGCACGPIMAAPNLIIAQWFAPQQRGTMVGIQAATVPVGAALAFALVPILEAKFGAWQLVLAWLSPLCFVSAAMVLIIAKRVTARQLEVRSAHRDCTDTGVGFSALAKNNTIWIAASCVFCLAWALQSFNDMAPGYFSIDKPVGAGLGGIKAGMMMALMQLSFLIGSLLTGYIGQRFFKGETRPVVILGFLISALAIFLLKNDAFVHKDLFLMTGILLLGFAFSLVNPQIFAFVANNFPPTVVGRVSGLVMGFGIVGGTAGVFFGSYFLHNTGAYHTPLTIIALVAMLGCLAAIPLRKSRNTI